MIAAATAILIISLLFIFKNSILSEKVVAATIKSLAILPFENIQNDSTLSFLSDGIPENLINRFSNIAGIKVFARSATFGLKDSSLRIENLRRLLNADMVLTGRLQKKGDGYFLNCELVDASNQNLIWGNKYELGLPIFQGSRIPSLHHYSTRFKFLWSIIQKLTTEKGGQSGSLC